MQAVVSSYEVTRGMREVGEKDDGFVVTASRTVAVGVEQLYDAVRGGAATAALAIGRR